MPRLLLTVEQVAPAVKGVMLQPYVSSDIFNHSFPLIITVRRPDGSIFHTPLSLGQFQHSMQEPPTEDWLAFCWLPEASVDDIPIGTELWTGDIPIG
jgi:hypothetical protein